MTGPIEAKTLGPSPQEAGISLLDQVIIGQMQVVHTNEDRTKAEFWNGEGGISYKHGLFIFIQEPEPGTVRVLGDHWERDWELFVIREGSIAKLVLEDIDTKERREYLNLQTDTRIILPPRVAHRLEFSESTVLLAMTETPYSSEKWIPYDFFPNSRTEALAVASN